MPHDEGFISINNYLGKQLDTVYGIAFYPNIRYKGLHAYPENWHSTSHEPLVMCLIPSLRVFVNESKEVVQQRRELLVDHGFEDGGREGLKGYVHVDDLEKIEGPPPDGPF